MATNGSADLVFVNGAVYTVDATRRRAPVVAVKDGRIVAVGHETRSASSSGPRTEVVDLRGRMLVPGFQDAHVHPLRAGLDMLRCDLHDVAASSGYRRRDPRVRRDASRRRVDPRRRLVDGRLPRWHADAGGPRRPSSPTARSSSPTATATRVGQLEGAGARRHHPRHPRPARRPDRARRRRQPHRDAARGRDGPRGGPLPPSPRPRSGTEGSCQAQRYLHSLGITAWQDAIVGGSLRRRLDAYLRVAGRGRAHRARRRRAVVGAASRPRADPRARRAPRARPGRALRRDQRQDHAGRRRRELHGRDARALPRRARGTPPTTAGSRSSTRSC